MFNRISVRIAVSLSAFVVLMLAAFLSSYVFIGKQDDASTLVKLASSEQRVAERIARDALLVASHVPGAATPASVQADMTAFQETLRALQGGGRSELAGRDLPPPTPAVAELARQADIEWGGLRAGVERLLNSSNPDDARAVSQSAARLGSALDALAGRAEADAAANVTTVMTLQALALAAVVVLWALILYFTWRDIGQPLRHLVAASEKMSTGDVESTIRFEGLVEVQELAQSFERMRLSVRTLLQGARPAGIEDLDSL